ncbi:hypothetical protein SAMN05216360_106287 [Methylobacterium phyllostachyos]|uniref:Uncharacterized protein n=1 Tax=Methylobacterium phyllostachyos TaxID=582672 RepID=A0A1G9ZIE1_9HYPH|nr:hypothetical protein SAMN05216360_106287 [Methylobacterium phyllostachyos]
MSLLDVIALLSVPVAALVLGLGALRYARWADGR